MTFQQWKNYKKHYILLNTTFEMPLFLLQEFLEQATAFDCYKYGLFLHDQQIIFQIIAFKICAKNPSNMFSFLQSRLKI